MKQHRCFTLEEISYTKEQIENILTQLHHCSPTDWTDYSIVWSMSDTGKRYVFLQLGTMEETFEVQHTTLLTTMNDFQKAFQKVRGVDLPLNEVIDKLALYDVQRALKWPLVAYYQSKISELANF